MKTYRILTITTLLILLDTWSLFSQTIINNQIVRNTLDEMFEDLDKTKVPTGYLLDYAMDLVEFERFNGSEFTDSNYVTPQIFEEMLYSINSASVSTKPFNDISQIMTDFVNNVQSQNINIGYIGYKYNYIKDSAIDENLISYNYGKVSDVYKNGTWQNPYEEAYLFGFTPSTSTCYTGTVHFKFSENFAFYNIQRSSLKFDAGDGLGYRGLSPTHTITVTYNTPGKKELKFYIKTTDGTILETHSSIYVIDFQSSDAYIAQMTTSILNPDTTSIYTSNTYTGNRVGALVTTYFRDGHTSLTKPFIVIEGFDPWRVLYSLDKDETKNQKLGSTNNINFHNKHWGNLEKQTYDLIYIDWYDSTEDIRDNAYLLIEIINMINQQKKLDGTNEKNIIMGQSMGGLVSRIALSIMESEGKVHDVSTYISHDAPHLGANVPLGALYFVKHVLSYIHGYQSVINLIDIFREKDLGDAQKIFWDMIHSPAVKQMLVNYLSTDGTLDNTYHNNWQTALNEYGFPEGDPDSPIQSLAIINGAPNNQSDIFNTLLGEHYLYLDGYAKTSVLTDIIAPFVTIPNIDMLLVILGTKHLAEAANYWGSTKFDVHAEINPFIGYRDLISDLRITYTKKFLWLESKTLTIFSAQAYSPSSGMLYDSFGGSKFQLTKTLEIKSPSANTWFYQYRFNYGLTDRIMFIPTVSSLNIYNANETNYLRDYYSNPPIPEIECPFDAYTLTDTIQNHIHINRTIYNWLYDQINSKILGPDYGTSGSQYSVSGYSGSVNWSTSNSEVATIDNNGKITASGNGIVTIIAENYSNGQLFRKKKDILVNFPDIIINHSYSAGNGYSFVACSVNNTATTILNNLVSSGELSYEWSLIDSNGDMETQLSSSNTFSYIPKKDEEITIAVRLVNTNGNKGPVKSMSIDLKTPMSVNYRFVIVDSDQRVHFIKSNYTYETGAPSQPFTVMFRRIAMNSSDNVTDIALMQKYMKGETCYISYPYGIRLTGYMLGTYQQYYTTWTFDFFNRAIFLDELEKALNQTDEDDKVIKEFRLTICNTNKEELQDIPFAIIYKSDFPSS